MHIVAPFGFYGWGNIGDEATLQGFAQLLARSGMRASVAVASHSPAHTARVEPAFSYFSPDVDLVKRWRTKLRASAYAVVGGTPIMDVLGDWPLSELTPLVRASERRKIPFVFIGSGVENLHSMQSRLVVATEIVPRVRHWSVRSERDRERLCAYGAAPETITVAADLAWLIEPATAEFGEQFLRRLKLDPKSPLIGVNLVNENSLLDREPGVVDALAAGLDALSQEWGAQVVFLANEVREEATFDKAAALKVLARMQHPERASIAPNEYLSPREMMSIVSCCDLTMSMRYHFCLFSALQGVPFIALERADKVADLCWDMQWAAREIPMKLQAEALLEHGRRLRREESTWRVRLKATVEVMKARAMKNMAALEALRSPKSKPTTATGGGQSVRQDPLDSFPPAAGRTNGVRCFYLSEMAESNLRGGGLSLQRVLQNDLLSFDLFVHLDDGARRDAPIVEAMKNRQWCLHELGRTWWLRDEFDRRMGRVHLRFFQRWSHDRWIREMGSLVARQFASEDCRWLVVPQSPLSVRVMNEVRRSRPVRYVTWMMDDHVVRWKNGWRYPRRYEAEFRFHLQHAEKVFVISPAMGRFYRDRFGVASEVLFGPADPEFVPVMQSPPRDGPVRLAYFGSILPWHCDALERLVVHLSKANARLDLFGLHDIPAELESPLVTARPPVPVAEVPSRMREYDGVVIPVSFKDELRHLTELNIATKLSECYASGTVTVIVGPENAAMVEFAKEHGGALVLSDFNDPAQMDALRNLRSPALRTGVVDAARRACASQCSTSVMRRRWAQVWNGSPAESRK